MAQNLDARIARAAATLQDAGCTLLAKVRAGGGVMDMLFFTAAGARLLVRCSTKRSPKADIDALAIIHQERTFDHVILLRGESARHDEQPPIIAFAELPCRASALAMLQPGWAA